MNALIFLASIIVSSSGVVLDNLTTWKFIKDIGKEYEWNHVFKKVCERWGYKIWMIIEVIIVTVFCLVDSVLGILFCGVFYGVFRGLAAAHNQQIISTYQTVGIDAFKKHSQYLNGFSQAIHSKKLKTNLQYFACSFICFIASILMFFVTAYVSLFSTYLSLTLYPVTGLVFGAASFLFAMGIVN